MPQNRDLPHGQTPSTMRLPNRRGFLQAGAIGGLGLCLGDVLRLQAQTSSGSLKPTADAVIHIFLPLANHRSPDRTAQQAMEPTTSDPAPDSDMARAPMEDPEQSPGRYFLFCSSFPLRRIWFTQRLEWAP